MTTENREAGDPPSMIDITYQGLNGEHHLVINWREDTVSLDGQHKAIRGKQKKLLLLLAEHAGSAMSRERILPLLYGSDTIPEVKILDVFVTKLREQLDVAPGHLIQTIWGRGYCFSETPIDTATNPERKKARAWTTFRKESVVSEVLDAGMSIESVARTHNLPIEELTLWIEAFTAQGRMGLQSQKLLKRRAGQS